MRAIRLGISRTTAFRLMAAAMALPVVAHDAMAGSAVLQPIWLAPLTVSSTPAPVVGRPSPSPGWEGTVLGQSADRRGAIVFLARHSDHGAVADVLLTDFEARGFLHPVPVQVDGAPASSPSNLLMRLFEPGRALSLRTPSVSAMTVDSEGGAWVGGSIGFYYGMASEAHGLAYLARLDDGGVAKWQKSYPSGTAPSVVSMVPAEGDDVLVAANDPYGESSWLAKIAGKDGFVIWERHVGNGHGIAVVRSGDGGFLVATVEGKGAGSQYQEDVAVRRFAPDGQSGSAFVVRPAINRESGMVFATISMSPAPDGAYVVTNWAVPFEQNPALLKPAEVAKVDPSGRLLWQRVMPTSFVLNTDRGGATFCERPAVATMQNGDALVACVLRGRLRIHQFNRLTGEDKQRDTSLPSCNDVDRLTLVSLFIRPDGQVLVSGGPPEGGASSDCSWLARLILKDIR